MVVVYLVLPVAFGQTWDADAEPFSAAAAVQLLAVAVDQLLSEEDVVQQDWAGAVPSWDGVVLVEVEALVALASWYKDVR